MLETITWWYACTHSSESARFLIKMILHIKVNFLNNARAEVEMLIYDQEMPVALHVS